jgi:hypothetical protein
VFVVAFGYFAWCWQCAVCHCLRTYCLLWGVLLKRWVLKSCNYNYISSFPTGFDTLCHDFVSWSLIDNIGTDIQYDEDNNNNNNFSLVSKERNSFFLAVACCLFAPISLHHLFYKQLIKFLCTLKRRPCALLITTSESLIFSFKHTNRANTPCKIIEWTKNPEIGLICVIVWKMYEKNIYKEITQSINLYSYCHVFRGCNY